MSNNIYTRSQGFYLPQRRAILPTLEYFIWILDSRPKKSFA